MIRAVDIIRAKRDGQSLTRQAIDAFVAGVTDGSWPDYQVSALLMAIVFRGMTDAETAWLTDAMVRSGRRLDLSHIPGRKVGKHSTGGVGDKVSIVLAPLAAACGVVVPKMSGRSLGHTGGTLDKLEAIPGFRADLSLDEFAAILGDVGCCLIGQTSEIAPADKTLYALRDVTGTVESIPLIASSVMSKKLAEGSEALVLDVKCGAGAFMAREDDARALARSMVAIGTAHGVRTEAFITAMDAPLGYAVGNALELVECVAALQGRGPDDLETLVLRLVSRMQQLASVASGDADGTARARTALESGAAFDRFLRMIRRQGGDTRVLEETGRLPSASRRRTVVARTAGFLTRLDAAALGRASMLLGAGRAAVGDAIDPAAGLVVRRKPGDPVGVGDPLVELHANDDDRLAPAAALVESAIAVDPVPPALPPLIRAWVRAEGETSDA